MLHAALLKYNTALWWQTIQYLIGHTVKFGAGMLVNQFFFFVRSGLLLGTEVPAKGFLPAAVPDLLQSMIVNTSV
jgi:hypothetical protein